ncbi:hypothetical protein [Lysinibacillus sp. NPDC056232]|uniref:hypothetical protein n=1 Tax=Lysinibacillus sp. NPDC056232 TaxID=3345756 RepID=UPI0035D68054
MMKEQPIIGKNDVCIYVREVTQRHIKVIKIVGDSLQTFCFTQQHVGWNGKGKGCPIVQDSSIIIV